MEPEADPPVRLRAREGPERERDGTELGVINGSAN